MHSQFSKINLLYVGDNPKLINQFSEESDKVNFYHQENGLQAIDFLKKHQEINAIISEAHLPGINGKELGLHIKKRLGYWSIPFIIICFEKNPDYKKDIFSNKQYIDDLYFYPVSTEDLLSRIHFLIHFLKEMKNTHPNSDSEQRNYKIPIIKRLFDIVVSSVAILILSPLFIIVAIAIKIESKGPVIYKSKRVGTGYKIFDFYKFRSMYSGADLKLKELKNLNQYEQKETETLETTKENEEECPRCAKLPEGEHCSPILYVDGKEICEYWYHKKKKKEVGSTFVKIKDDPRITKVGKIIRNTSIDELPQLFNVLKGDMSIVGNRPLPLYEAEQLTSDDWSKRFLAPAGITGLWQVELRGKGGKMSEEERKKLDNSYADHYSFWKDIILILRTIPALFQKENV